MAALGSLSGQGCLLPALALGVLVLPLSPQWTLLELQCP